MSLYLFLALSFCWSGHIYSSLRSAVLNVTNIYDCSLEMLSKYICLLSFSLYLYFFLHCHCLFVGQVVSPHHSDQMSQRLQVSRVGILRCLLNIFVSVSKLLSMVFFKNQLNSDKVTQTMEQCYEKTLKMEADFSRIAMKQDISPWWSSWGEVLARSLWTLSRCWIRPLLWELMWAFSF